MSFNARPLPQTNIKSCPGLQCVNFRFVEGLLRFKYRRENSYSEDDFSGVKSAVSTDGAE